MNTLLFDTSIPPEEQKPPKQKRARATAGPQPEAEAVPKKPLIFRDIRPLGRIDHTHECVDERCSGSAHDILHEERGEWLIQCCFCLTCQWVPVIQGHLEPKATEFQFRDGRFAGMTIDEAVALPRGLDYVLWASREHKRPAVKTACETWLAKNQSSR